MSPSDAAARALAPDSRLTRVLEAIAENPSLDVNALAKLVNLSPSRLQHLFKERLGIAIREAVGEQKLRKAARLLVSTDLRIKEITFEVGYEHSSSFVRAFRKRYVTTPESYRKSAASTAESANIIPLA